MRLGASLTLAVSLAVVPAAAGCASGDGGTPPKPSPTASQSKSPTRSGSPGVSRKVELSADLSSQYSKTATAGPDDRLTYGYSQLDGYAKVNDKSVRVRFQGLVESDDGDGPISGFLELRWSDGSTLVLRQSGRTTRDTGSKRTEYQADLAVIGGTKDLVDTTGAGKYTGSRSGSSGSSLRLALTLDLSGAPSKLVGNVASAIPSSSYAATIEP